MEGKKLFKGVNYVYNQSKDYENETVTINFFSPLGKNSAMDSLLIYLLSDSCTKYKTNAELTSALNEVCGGKIDSSVSKAGDEVVLSLNFSCPTSTMKSFKEGVEILSQCLFRPNITPEGFIEENVQKEKKKIFAIERKLNENKATYAQNKLTEKMCESETFSLSVYGTKQQMEEVTCKELLNRWLRIMRNCPVQINYIGSFEPKITEDIFYPLFKALERKEVWPIKTEFIPTAYEKGEYTKKIKSEHEYVCAGFRAGMSYDRDSYESAMLFTQLYSNLLNQSLEEKGISEQCTVKLDDDKGILTVICTVKDGKSQDALEEIRGVLKKIQAGEFLPSKLGAAKAALTRKLENTEKDVNELNTFMMSFTKNSVFLKLEEIISKVSKICREEVIVSACMTDEDTILTLLKA